MVVLRGIPGSGKSTYIRTNLPGALVVSADHFFEVDGEYRFDPTKLGEAHGTCFRKAIAAVQEDAPLVVVDNTNTTAAEAAPYVLLGQAHGYDVEVRTLTVDPSVAAARNVHGVPEAAVQAMDARLRAAELPPFWKQSEV